MTNCREAAAAMRGGERTRGRALESDPVRKHEQASASSRDVRSGEGTSCVSRWPRLPDARAYRAREPSCSRRDCLDGELADA